MNKKASNPNCLTATRTVVRQDDKHLGLISGKTKNTVNSFWPGSEVYDAYKVELKNLSQSLSQLSYNVFKSWKKRDVIDMYITWCHHRRLLRISCFWVNIWWTKGFVINVFVTFFNFGSRQNEMMQKTNTCRIGRCVRLLAIRGISVLLRCLNEIRSHHHQSEENTDCNGFQCTLFDEFFPHHILIVRENIFAGRFGVY